MTKKEIHEGGGPGMSHWFWKAEVAMVWLANVLLDAAEKISDHWHLLADYPWVVMDKDTGWEWDRYHDWRDAHLHAGKANIYSQRLGTDRRYVVRYEGRIKRMIMPGIRYLFGRYA